MYPKSRNKIIQEDLDSIIASDLEWSRLEGKTILVTGANGFLPAYMVETILYLNEIKFKNKAKVIALVRNINKAKLRFDIYNKRNDLEFLVQDVCDPINLMDKIDFIIHAASQASPKYYGVDPVGTLNPNVIGTNNLLQLAYKKLVESFLFFSSGEIYGDVKENQIPTTEKDYGYLDPTQIRSCYAESKRMGENMCISWLHQYGIPIKIVRPFHTYGPGMALDDGRVYADFVADIISNRDIVMKSDGAASRAFCYITDATIAFFTVMLKGENGEAYNVSNSNCEIKILDLAKILVDLIPLKKLKVIRDESNRTSYLRNPITRNCPDSSKIISLGWRTNIGLKEGFNRTIWSYE